MMGATATEAETQRTPYRGLRPFLEEDAPYFFGRDRDKKRVMASLFGSSFTILYGPSGVGKSSLLNAGLLHDIRERGNLVAVAYRSWVDGDAGDTVASEVVQAARDLGLDIGDEFAGSPLERLTRVVKAVDERETTDGKAQRPIVVVLDQFEDYTKYYALNPEFDRQLAEIVRALGASISVLVSIREDNLALLDHFKPLISDVFNNYLRVDYLDRTGAEEAIHLPLERWALDGGERVSAEKALADELLKAASQFPDDSHSSSLRASVRQEPLVETAFLQLVLERMWRERADGKLALEKYNELGQAEAILRDHVGGEMARLKPEQRELAALMIPYIVTASGLKLAQHAADLQEAIGRSEKDIAEVFELLEESGRILRALDPPSIGPYRRRYEPYHDRIALALNRWKTEYDAVDATAVKFKARLKRQLDRAVKDATSRIEERQRRAVSSLITLAANTYEPKIAEEARTQLQRLARHGQEGVREEAEEASNSLILGMVYIVQDGIYDAFYELTNALETKRVDGALARDQVTEMVELGDLLTGFCRNKNEVVAERAKEAKEDLRLSLGEDLWRMPAELEARVPSVPRDALQPVLAEFGVEPGKDAVEEPSYVGMRIVVGLLAALGSCAGFALGEVLSFWWLGRSNRFTMSQLLWPLVGWLVLHSIGVLVLATQVFYPSWGDAIGGSFMAAAFAGIGWFAATVLALMSYKTFDVPFSLVLWIAAVISNLIWWWAAADY